MTFRINARLLMAGSLLGIAGGLGLGIAAHRWEIAALYSLSTLLEPIGTVWVNALRMIVLPLVVSQLVVAIATSADASRTGRMGGLTLTGFVGLLVVAGIFTIAVGPAVIRQISFDPATLEAFRASAAAESEAAGVGPSAAAGALPGEEGDAAAEGTPGFGEWIVALVPPNPVRSAADGDILPVVVFTVLFALALSRITARRRALVVDFFRGIAEATLVLVGWLLAVLPLGVFALALSLGAESGIGVAGVIGYWILLLCGMLVAFTVLLYPLTALVAGVPMRRFAWGTGPSQAVAMGTRSSLASLPALLEGAERRIGLPPAVAAFTLPLAVSTFKVNRTISTPLRLLFLASVYGITLEPGYVVVVAATALLMSFSTPGIPSTGSMAMLPFYLAAGIPVEGVVLLKAVDAIPDIFKTMTNVTADMSVAAVVARFAGAQASDDGGDPGGPGVGGEPGEHGEWGEPSRGAEEERPTRQPTPVGGSAPARAPAPVAYRPGSESAGSA